MTGETGEGEGREPGDGPSPAAAIRASIWSGVAVVDMMERERV